MIDCWKIRTHHNCYPNTLAFFLSGVAAGVEGAGIAADGIAADGIAEPAVSPCFELQKRRILKRQPIVNLQNNRNS